MMNRIHKFNRGQSLVEVVVACGIIGISLTAIMIMVSSSRDLLYKSEDQTKATALAQEAIDIVKHQRDIGCSYANITDEDGNLITNNFVVEGDTEAGSSEDLIPGSIVDTTDIDNFAGFMREIQISNLSDYGSEEDIADSNFRSSDYDTLDDYYFVRVIVRKDGELLSEVKTVISK